MLKKQMFCPQIIKSREAVRISELSSLDFVTPPNAEKEKLTKLRIHAGKSFCLVGIDDQSEKSSIFYSSQENFVKFHIRLAGKQTIVFDGVGQYELEQPQLLMVSCPAEMVKVDLTNGGERNTSVSLAVNRDFFIAQMGIDPESLPDPLRAMVLPDKTSFALHSFPLSLDLTFAARAFLEADYSIPMSDLYYQAKAVELMCLLIRYLEHSSQLPVNGNRLTGRKVQRLNEVRDLLKQCYAEPLTLDQISSHAGLSKTALTSGFIQLFGHSVFECLQKERMLHAYELLQRREHSIAQVAELVGYGQACNFSTAFRRYFGCTPMAIYRDKAPH